MDVGETNEPEAVSGCDAGNFIEIDLAVAVVVGDVDLAVTLFDVEQVVAARDVGGEARLGGGAGVRIQIDHAVGGRASEPGEHSGGDPLFQGFDLRGPAAAGGVRRNHKN